MSDTEIRSDCEYAELNRANGIICTPMDKCNLCEQEEMTPEERHDSVYES